FFFPIFSIKMDVSDRDRVIFENLRETENAPQPLDPDFYKDIVAASSSSSSGASSCDFELSVRPNVNSATEATVKKILNESQPLIDKAALKLVASNAVNVVGPQYHDLVKLSVDEAAIVQAEEDAVNVSRRKANASVLGRH
ncbi:hypothetical protein PFISCL1PPCAC_6476, partial [Pristionchus fissidentatus]